ncbi:unnamed protein product, partial [Rotaria sp. Silwood2]
MALTKKFLITIGSLVTIVIIGLAVGISVGIVVGRQKPTSLTVEKQASQILENNPLIDG